MAIPNRPRQIEKIAEFLEDPVNDERSVQDVAKLIVDGMYDMWTRGESSPPIPLVVGLAFKVPTVSKIYHVAWMGDMWWGSKMGTVNTVWIVNSDSDYGSVMPTDRPFWRIVTPSTAKSGAPGNNKDDWKVGDKISMGQRAHHYEIIATGDKTVLMNKRDQKYIIQAESNAGLKKFYRREK